MTFNELINFMQNKGVSSLAEIARELEVSPQSVSNWKARGQVPYKYIVYIQNKYNLDQYSEHTQEAGNIENVYTHNIDIPEIQTNIKTQKKKDDLSIIKDDEIDLLVMFQKLWNDRRRILQITAVVTIIGIIYALFSTPLYKSTITMYPAGKENSGQLSQLQGMASTLGFDVGGGEPSFHIPDIVQSRQLKTELIYHEWNSEKFNKPVNLIDYWDINQSGGNSVMMEANALKVINGRIEVTKGKATELISVNIWMEEAQVSADIANFIYSSIDNFTINVHNKQAKLNREFIELRQNETREVLRIAEESLKVFRERNRSIINSPQLQLELERFMREVEIQTQVYITLQQQYELARIEEVKKTPSVIILDYAKPAQSMDIPKRKKIVLVSFILGGFIGILYLLLIYYVVALQESRTQSKRKE